jgi:multicomponent Na+:H+ antiporter subunit F
VSLVIVLCTAALTAAAVLLVVRIALGPTMMDRVVALDVLVSAMICWLGVEAAVNRHTTTLPILVVLSMVGFVGSVSMARFNKGSDDVEAERP